MTTLLTYCGCVYPWHCDHMGHMNVMWYAGKFDEATWQLFAKVGMSRSFLEANKRGMAAVQQETTYRKELLAGETIVIESEILEVREKVIRFKHTMIHQESGDAAAISTLTGVHLDLMSRQSIAFPSDIFEKARFLVKSPAHDGEQ